MTGELIGRAIPRREDARLLTGRARYLADIQMPGMLDAAFVRSPFAHAAVSSIGSSVATEVPGVVGVLTNASLPAHSALVDSVSIDGLVKTPQSPLANGVVRFVGEPVAVVVGDDRYVAEDGAGAVEVEYDLLDPVMSVQAGMNPGSPLLFPELGTNIVYRGTKTFGDPAHAFAGADRVYEGLFEGGRLTATPIETRGCLASFDAGRGELAVWSSTQGPHLLRRRLATTTGLPENRIRVVAADVGGGFGQKIPASPEEVAIALSSIALERPVRWIEDRRENLTAAPHAKQQTVTTEIAVDRDGTFVAMRSQVIGDAGAFSFNTASALIEPYLSALLMPSVYKIEHFECEIVAVLTNKAPVSPYRGVGWTASHTARELLIDEIAADGGWDPAELRRRNMIRSAELPHTNAVGMVYDSGSYQESLDDALALADYRGFRERQRRARESGRFLGIGISPYVEPNGWGSEGAHQTHWAFASYDSARVTMDPSGLVTVAIGAPSQGQGHETSLAQIAADALGVALDVVKVEQNDTATTPASIAGTRASRVAVVLGGAISVAALELKDRLLRVASILLEVAEEDLRVADGRVFVSDTSGRGLAVAEVAAAAHFDPSIRAAYPDPLMSVERFHDPRATYSNGCIVATVEVDPGTGGVEVEGIVVIEDCGKMINPLIVEGQSRGAAAQGLGCALFEGVAYDDAGQILTGTLMDYLIPTASDVPAISIGHIESLSPHTMHGAKGMGESGMIAVPAAIANAVADAIPGHAVIARLPVTPDDVASAFEASAAVAEE